MKNSSLDPSLLADDLVDVVDDVRRSVHGALGTRPWKVEIVTRRWDGGLRGAGKYRDSVLELDPIPLVERTARNRMAPGGSEAAGDIQVSEISLRYTEAEIYPSGDRSTEVAWRITDILGTKQRVRWFQTAGAPVPKRGDKAGDDISWHVRLNETPDFGKFDEVHQS